MLDVCRQRYDNPSSWIQWVDAAQWRRSQRAVRPGASRLAAAGALRAPSKYPSTKAFIPWEGILSETPRRPCRRLTSRPGVRMFPAGIRHGRAVEKRGLLRRHARRHTAHWWTTHFETARRSEPDSDGTVHSVSRAHRLACLRQALCSFLYFWREWNTAGESPPFEMSSSTDETVSSSSSRWSCACLKDLSR